MREAVVSTRNGGQVTFALPASNPEEACAVVSVAGVRGTPKAAEAVQTRSGGNGRPAASVSPKTLDWALPGLCR
ncbi:hypothetical protein MPNT_190013 [Candidatus Methylacidithermus pantelleriae]|uniref:Uncharacterized protein n=1 Tax=Candidatus Methylacidithermus pantelleriae TaxID=2744239 RepID=A0A8J2BK61_9BACT|nr:hypothetical protein MPNT_190013 [Candidatus Methylacidithermus pantelleriae]